MMNQSKRKQVLLTACLMTSLTLAACGGGGNSSDSSTPASTTVSGTAATGAPIAGGAIDLICKNDWTGSTTTGSDGTWHMNVPTDDLPCAVRVTTTDVPPQSYYSIASGTGSTVTANVSPLTTLALAKAFGESPATSWASLDGTDIENALTELSTGIAGLNTLLASYALPDSFNPFTTELHPGTANDPYDTLLEQLKTALGDGSFDDLVASVAAGGSLPPAPSGGGDGGTGGGSDTITTPTLTNDEFGVRFATNGTVMDTAESGVVRFIAGAGGFEVKNGSLLEAYVLDSSDSTLNLDLRYLPNNTGSYDCGDALSAGDNQKTIALGYAVNNGYSSLGTKGVSGYSCNITITHVGSISGSSYTGYIEGTFKARLNKTGEAANPAHSIVVAGSFRFGTGPVDDGDTSGQTAITLTAKSSGATAADIAPLVGHYTGNLGWDFNGDASTPVATTTTCSIDVASDGTASVTVNGRTLSAAFNGDAGDLTSDTSATTHYSYAQAGDTAADNYVFIKLANGRVTTGDARHGAYDYLSATNHLQCNVVNPNPTVLGSSLATGDLNGGATASDLPASYAGSYSNGTCSLTVSADGVFSVTNNGNSVEARLGGDQDDRVIDHTTQLGTVAITATDLNTDRNARIVVVQRYTDGHYMVSSVKIGSTVQSDFEYPACDNLTKQ